MSPAIAVIQRAVAAEHGMTVGELLRRRRTRSIVRPRQLALWLCCTLLQEQGEASLPEIARAFGLKDHTTVIHARDVTQRRLEVSERLSAMAAACAQRVLDQLAVAAESLEAGGRAADPRGETHPSVAARAPLRAHARGAA